MEAAACGNIKGGGGRVGRDDEVLVGRKGVPGLGYFSQGVETEGIGQVGYQQIL